MWHARKGGVIIHHLQIRIALNSHQVGLLSFGNDEQVGFAWKMYRQKGNEDMATKYRQAFAQTIRIYFLGLWYVISCEVSPSHV
jgi:hypothetical protein